MLISQDVVRREIIYVKDRPNNMAIDLIQTLVVFACEHCEITILEGILNVELYENLFRIIGEIFANDIYAYYFDITFEETIKRHSQKPNSSDFGETEMRRWWKEKDFIPNIPERILKEDMSEDYIVDYIYNDVIS